MSSDYYDRHAATFIADTLHVDMAPLRERFRALLPAHATILDAGCGSGRDAKAFLDLGHEVVAFDASDAMVRHASALLGQPVRHLRFEDLEDVELYDGVWCSASLLHVPERHLPAVFARVFRALKPGGVCYMSFKLGQGERAKDGRVFTDQDEASLSAHFAALPAVEVLGLWRTIDRRPSRAHEQWLNALARKRPLNL